MRVADWSDWNEATFTRLEDSHPELGETLRSRVVDGFLLQARLSTTHREEALAGTGIDLGVTPKGVHIIRVTFPIGAGKKSTEWHGSAVDAEAIVDAMTERAAEDVVWDQDNFGPTGWEPEFDGPPGRTTTQAGED